MDTIRNEQIDFTVKVFALPFRNEFSSDLSSAAT